MVKYPNKILLQFFHESLCFNKQHYRFKANAGEKLLENVDKQHLHFRENLWVSFHMKIGFGNAAKPLSPTET